METGELWPTLAGLGVGAVLLRFSFLGGLFGRLLPGWAGLPLRLGGAAAIPALTLPGVIGAEAGSTAADAVRIVVVLAALVFGLAFRSVLIAVLAAVAALYTAPVAFGL